jgi:hypothetical protein
MMMLKAAFAGALVLGLAAAAPAAAQDRHDNHMQGDRHDQNMRGDRDRDDQGMRGDRDRDRDRGYDRDHRDHGRHMGWRDHYNNGNHYGWRNHRHCTWTWRHHRRVRVCY